MSIEHDAPSTAATGAATGTGYASSSSPSSSASPQEAVSTAADEARHLAHEAKEQASTVLDRARDDVGAQLRDKGKEASEAMRRLADEFGCLASGRPDEAPRAREYVEMAEQRLNQMANRLDYGGPESAIDDIRGFARRHPGSFLAIAAGVGFGIARLARAGAASKQQETSRAQTPQVPSDLSSLSMEPPVHSTSGVTGVAV